MKYIIKSYFDLTELYTPIISHQISLPWKPFYILVQQVFVAILAHFCMMNLNENVLLGRCLKNTCFLRKVINVISLTTLK